MLHFGSERNKTLPLGVAEFGGDAVHSPSFRSGYRSLVHNDPDVASSSIDRATLKRVLAFGKPYRGQLTLLLVFITIAAITAVATPILAGNIVNAIVAGTDRTWVVTLAGIIAGIAILDAALSLVERLISSRIGEGLIYDLRRSVFEHVLRMPIAFFTRTQTGALVSRVNNDVIGAQRAFTGTLTAVTSNSIQLLLTALAMFALSWQIAALSLVLLPIFIFPARRMGARLAAITREQQQLNAGMTATMTERFNVAGALLVKLFGRPEAETAAFSSRAARVRDIGVQSAMLGRIFFVALTLVATLAQALVYGLGGWLALSGSLSAGTVVSLALLLTRLYGPLTALSNVRVDVMSALVSFERVFEVIDLKPAITDRPDAVAVPARARRVEFDNVHFAYPAAAETSLISLEDGVTPDNSGPNPVLHGVSFTAEPGELVALVGPSGAGKSTIASLLSRLYDVDSGAVRVDGLDVRDVTQQSLHDAVGVVTQDSHLFHDTIGANLRYARPESADSDLWDALERAHVADLVRGLPEGLDTVVGERGYRLSGGEKQRIAIARLLLRAPGIVILDEATAHLDSESEAAVQRALDSALSGRTALVIAHRLSTVRAADKILVISGGRIAEQGTHDELLADGGAYADLYRTQFGVVADVA